MKTLRNTVPLKIMLSALSVRGLASRWLVATLVITTGILGSARAQAFVVTSSRFLPVAGTVFDEDTGEDVTHTGQVHVVTQFDAATSMLTVHTNLPPTFGIGVSSGLGYLANGTDQIPPNSCFPPTALFGFTTECRLWPPDPIGGIVVAQPLQVQFDLTIGADGKLQEGVVTSVSSGCNPTMGDCP